MVEDRDAEQNRVEAESLLKVLQSERQGKCTVEARGDVDLSTVSRLREVLESICTASQKPRAIAVDLRSVTFIDSAGLALLVDIRNRYGSVAPLSILIRAGSQPDRVLKLGQFDRFIPTERDEANRGMGSRM